MTVTTEYEARKEAARRARKTGRIYYVVREGDGYDWFSEDDEWMIEGQTPIAIYGP